MSERPEHQQAEREALWACPFCGKEPHGVFGPDEHLGSCWVECWGPSDDICCGHWHFEGSREETAAAWNRRAGERADVLSEDEIVQAALKFNGGFDYSCFRDGVKFAERAHGIAASQEVKP